MGNRENRVGAKPVKDRLLTAYEKVAYTHEILVGGNMGQKVWGDIPVIWGRAFRWFFSGSRSLGAIYLILRRLLRAKPLRLRETTGSDLLTNISESIERISFCKDYLFFEFNGGPESEDLLISHTYP